MHAYVKLRAFHNRSEADNLRRSNKYSKQLILCSVSRSEICRDVRSEIQVSHVKNDARSHPAAKRRVLHDPHLNLADQRDR